MHRDHEDASAGLHPAGKPSISDHELLRRIDRGSYGEVWLARNVMGHYRAVKVVYRGTFREARPFERELAGIQKFEPISRSHEGLVDVLHFGQHPDEGYFYYIMEVADDVEHGQELQPETYEPRTLSRELAGHKRLSFAECAQLGLSLSHALDHLHRHGLVHRDIKPSNIIFVNGTPKLADIGLVAGFEEAGSFVGTEGYVPPEGPGKPQADIYSLGKVLYECCTGQDRSAFPRLPLELEQGEQHEQFLELNEVILRACHHDPNHRYLTADALHADLAFVLSGHSVKRLRILERRLAKLKKAAVSLALIALVAGSFLFVSVRESTYRAKERQRQVGAHLAYGFQAMDNGNFIQALPSFLEALRLDDPQRADKHRLRLGTLIEQCPKLLQLWTCASELNDAQFSPDGRFLIVAPYHANPAFIDLEHPERPAVLLEDGNSVEKLAVSPDGRALLLANWNGKVTVWDWRARKRLATLPHPNVTAAACFGPRGDVIVTGCHDARLRLWDARTFTLLATLPGHNDAVLGLRFSHDGRLLASVGRDQLAIVWNTADWSILSRLRHNKSWIYTVAFSPDDRRLATGCFHYTAHVWDVALGQQVLPPLKHRDAVCSVEFSPDGRLLLTGCWDGTARLWDANTGAPAYSSPVLPHSGRVNHAGFHPDGHRFITVCVDGTARLWDLAAARSSLPSLQAQLSPDGTRYLLHSNRWIQVAEMEAGRTLARVDLPGDLLEAGFSANSHFLLARTGPPAAKTGELSIVKIDTARRIAILPSFARPLTNVVLSEQAQWLASWGGNQVTRYDLSSRQPLPPLVHSQAVVAAYFSPSGQELLALSSTKAYLWDVRTGKLRFTLAHPKPLRFAQFSSDGHLILTGTGDNSLLPCDARIWNATTGQLVGPPLQHQDGLLYGSFSPDNRRVVTCSEDFTAAIWDLQQPGQPKKLPHEHQVRGACFSANGDCVLTVSRDETARLWDAESGEPLTPPLPHGADLFRAAFLPGNRWVVSGRGNDAWVHALNPDSRPIADLQLLVRLLNGQDLRPASRPAPDALTLDPTFQQFRSKYPDSFQTAPDELIAWHYRQAQLAKKERQWLGALFHLDRLLALEPSHTLARQWRKEVQESLEAETTTAPKSN